MPGPGQVRDARDELGPTSGVRCFSLQCHRNGATGVSPFRASFCVDTFEFDACLGLELRLEDEPRDVAQRLSEVHGELYKKAMRSRA
jgi:hypothetical protein